MRFTRVLVAAASLSLAVAPITEATGFGINAHIPSAPIADRIQSAGIEWVRIDVLWSLIEPERDVYDWSIYDALVERLESRGLRIYAGLGSTPGWATGGSEFNGVPDDVRQWREFCYLAAHRYAGRVQAWGVWNEPNLGRFWQGTRQQYIDVIAIPGAESIRLGDPTALVCAPDLAHLSSADWDTWLDATIRAAGDVLDVVTHHIYPSDGWPSEVTYDLETGGPFPFSPPSVLEVLQRTGWWQRPFWLTETGVESARWGEGRQANFVDGLLTQWFAPTRAYRNWVDRLFFYEMNDGPDPSATTWGLIRGGPEFEPKASYYSYSDFITGAAVDDAEIVSSHVPASYLFGESRKSTVTFRNTGTTPWSADDLTWFNVEIETPGWDVVAEQLHPGETIAPGDTHAYHLIITPPSLPLEGIGDDPVLWARMERVGAWAYGEPLRMKLIVSFVPPPTITRQPEPGFVAPGASKSLTIVAAGSEPLMYRWLRNGVTLVDNEFVAGSQTASLTLTALSDEIEAFYQCIVSDGINEVVSDAAAVAIGLSAPRQGRSRVSPDDPTRPEPANPDAIRYSGPAGRR